VPWEEADQRAKFQVSEGEEDGTGEDRAQCVGEDHRCKHALRVVLAHLGENRKCHLVEEWNDFNLTVHIQFKSAALEPGMVGFHTISDPIPPLNALPPPEYIICDTIHDT